MHWEAPPPAPLHRSPADAHRPPPCARPRAPAGDVQKARRAAAGSEAVRDQIKKLAVGGPQTKEERAAVYQISDSEDEWEAPLAEAER